MNGIENIEEVFEVGFSLFAVIEEKKKKCKQGKNLKTRGKMRCD
jgi:hypothetical protein